MFEALAKGGEQNSEKWFCVPRMHIKVGLGGVLFVCMAGTFLSVLFLLMLLFLCWCSVHICVMYFAHSFQGRANCLSYRLTVGWGWGHNSANLFHFNWSTPMHRKTLGTFFFFFLFFLGKHNL